MSQEKVDKRKHEKENRAKLLKREKMQNKMRKVVGVVVVIVIAFWMLYSLYGKWDASRERSVITADFTSVSEYVNNLSKE